MINRLRNVVANVVESFSSIPAVEHNKSNDCLEVKFAYSRPEFLQFVSADELQVSADHSLRPIIVPRDVRKMPWNTGYAEVINAGKSLQNEDQSSIQIWNLNLYNSPSESSEDISTTTSSGDTSPNVKLSPITNFISDDQSVTDLFTYFAIFDGHAGAGAALMAANSLHLHIQEKLNLVKDLLFPSSPTEEIKNVSKLQSTIEIFPEKSVSKDSLITGALEAAFWSMDQQIRRERLIFKISGGCTALVALFFQGKLYIANAGDSRAIIVQNKEVFPMSQDFTPETERQRLQFLGYLHPELLGPNFNHLEFSRRPTKKDIGGKILFRNAFMTGWSFKTITEDDLKFPLIYGIGKQARVLATIGVTRGFGDHDLRAQSGDVYVKPFLSPHPEVRVFDLEACNLTEDDVLIMGSDGFWDVTSNTEAAEIVQKTLTQFRTQDITRYTSAAQDLVMNSRGRLKDHNWKMTDDSPASGDDISVYVIPLCKYKDKHFSFSE